MRSHVLTLDRFGSGHVPHGLTVATGDRSGDANFFSIVASDLEAVRTPAQVRLCDSDFAVVATSLMRAGMPAKETPMNAHDAVDPLAIDGRAPSPIA